MSCKGVRQYKKRHKLNKDEPIKKIDCKKCRNYKVENRMMFEQNIYTGEITGKGFPMRFYICLHKKRRGNRNFDIISTIRKSCKQFTNKKDRTLKELLQYAKNTQL